MLQVTSRRLMISIDELLLIHNQFHDTTINESLMEINLEKFRKDVKYSERIENKLRIQAEENKDPASKLNYMEINALKALYKGNNQVIFSMQNNIFRNIYLM